MCGKPKGRIPLYAVFGTFATMRLPKQMYIPWQCAIWTILFAFYEMMLILGGGIIFRCMKTDEMLLEQINGIEQL